MKISAQTAVRNLPEPERKYLRFLFGNIIATGFCSPHTLGLEATHETLEFMYDQGDIKLTFEPVVYGEQISLGRIMLYVPTIGAYQVITGLKLDMIKGAL